MKKLAFERYMMLSSCNTREKSGGTVSCDTMQGNNRKEGLLQNLNQNNQTSTGINPGHEVSKNGMHPNCTNFSNFAVLEDYKKVSPGNSTENSTAMSFYESMQGNNKKEPLPQNLNLNYQASTGFHPGQEVSKTGMHPNCTNVFQSSNATSPAMGSLGLNKAEEMKKLALQEDNGRKDVLQKLSKNKMHPNCTHITQLSNAKPPATGCLGYADGMKMAFEHFMSMCSHNMPHHPQGPLDTSPFPMSPPTIVHPVARPTISQNHLSWDQQLDLYRVYLQTTFEHQRNNQE